MTAGDDAQLCYEVSNPEVDAAIMRFQLAYATAKTTAAKMEAAHMALVEARENYYRAGDEAEQAKRAMIEAIQNNSGY